MILRLDDNLGVMHSEGGEEGLKKRIYRSAAQSLRINTN